MARKKPNFDEVADSSISGIDATAALDLRRRAEKKSKADEPDYREPRSLEETRHVLHELHVHQIELEMQNEELRRAQEALEALRARYFDLYDLAPIGYLVLDKNGQILDANLTAATLLGEVRGTLLHKPITRLIHPSDQDIYYRHRKDLFETGAPQACELRFLKKDGSPFWARVEAAAAKTADGVSLCRAAVSDITDRKKAEILLQESRARYEAIFEATGTATLLVEEDTTILMANRECLPVTGYRPDELVGTKWPHYVAPESLELMLKRHHARREESGQAPGKYEVKMINKSGQIRDVLMDIAVIPGTKQSVVSMLDITEHKRAEERLAGTVAYIRSLIEASQDPLVTIDPDGKITDANKASELAVGLSRDELIGTEFSGYFTEPDKARSGYEKAFAEGSVTDFPLSLRHKSGRIMDVLYNATVYRNPAGKVKGVFAAARDITERKRAEEALRASQQLVSGIINAMPVRVFWKDKDLVFLGCNEAFARDAGFTDPKDIVGKDDFQMVWRDQAELYRGDDRQVISSGCSKLLIEEPQTTPDGHTITVLTSKIPLRDSKGEISGVLGAYMDITERKQAEDAVRASLREKDVLLREIHHRVKNNMQVISSLFNLQAGKIGDEEARRMLKEGQLRIRSMALVHEKLYRSPDLSKIDFAAYIRSLSTHLFQFFEVDPKRILLETDLEDVSMDVNLAVPCGLLVNELITNALKHAFPGERKGRLGLKLRRGEDRIVEIQVSDDGIGFPDTIDFYRTESLGLQIVNLLIGQLDGTIKLNKDKGTACTITFSESVGRQRT